MNVVTIVALPAITLLIVWVLWPMLHRNHDWQEATGTLAVGARKSEILEAVADLDDDYRMGHLDQATYDEQKKQKVQQLTELLEDRGLKDTE